MWEWVSFTMYIHTYLHTYLHTYVCMYVCISTLSDVSFLFVLYSFSFSQSANVNWFAYGILLFVWYQLISLHFISSVIFVLGSICLPVLPLRFCCFWAGSVGDTVTWQIFVLLLFFFLRYRKFSLIKARSIAGIMNRAWKFRGALIGSYRILKRLYTIFGMAKLTWRKFSKKMLSP